MAKLRPVLGGTYHFWCPGCKCAHGFGPGWAFNGDMEKPTVSPSLLTQSETTPLCHLHIVDGVIQFLPDCGHDLRGKSVPLEEWPF